MRRKKKVTPVQDPEAIKRQEEMDKKMQWVALALAFASVFYFFVKLVFL